MCTRQNLIRREIILIPFCYQIIWRPPFPRSKYEHKKRRPRRNSKKFKNTIGMNCSSRQPILYAALEDGKMISLSGETLPRYPPLTEECVRDNGREDSVGKFPMAMLVSPFRTSFSTPIAPEAGGDPTNGPNNSAPSGWYMRLKGIEEVVVFRHPPIPVPR